MSTPKRPGATCSCSAARVLVCDDCGRTCDVPIHELKPLPGTGYNARGPVAATLPPRWMERRADDTLERLHRCPACERDELLLQALLELRRTNVDASPTAKPWADDPENPNDPHAHTRT